MSIIAECKSLTETLAPDLAGAVVIDAASIPGAGGCAYGFAIPPGESPDLSLNKPVIGLCLTNIERDALPGRFAACCRATTIHELAHVALFRPEPLVLPLEPTQADIDYLQARREAFLANPPRVDPWADPLHDWRFLRAALHLSVRADLLGLDAPLSAIILSPIHASYVDLVRDEAIQMRWSALKDIAATPPPAAFIEAWERRKWVWG